MGNLKRARWLEAESKAVVFECLACDFTPSEKPPIPDSYEDKVDAAREYHRWARRARGYFAADGTMLPYIGSGEGPEKDASEEDFTVADWRELTALVRLRLRDIRYELARDYMNFKCFQALDKERFHRAVLALTRRSSARASLAAPRRAHTGAVKRTRGGDSGDDTDGDGDPEPHAGYDRPKYHPSINPTTSLPWHVIRDFRAVSECAPSCCWPVASQGCAL
jgi:hypothetical protein